ncbi:MAG: hypothetical protein PHD30_08875 [Paludibacter sp.]|nr:hypothetical protein [Paludibacter sp.]
MWSILFSKELDFFSTLSRYLVEYCVLLAGLMYAPSGGYGWDFSKDFKFKEEVLSELTSWLKDIK